MAILMDLGSLVVGTIQQVKTSTLTYAASVHVGSLIHGETQYFMEDITGDCTITISKPTIRGNKVTFVLTSDSVGGHTITFGDYFTPSGTMTLVASQISVIQFIYTPSEWKEEFRIDGTAGGGGGTGLPSASQGDTLYASATDTWANLAKSATATRYIANTGTSNNPKWDQVNLTNGVTGVLPMANGGSGKALTASANKLVYSDADSFELLDTGNSGVLVTSGAGVPSIATDIPTGVTIGTKYIYRAEGTDIPITDGGTGASDAATARTNLGLGTIAVLASPLPAANGGAPATRIMQLLDWRPSPDGAANSGILAEYYDRVNYLNYIRWTSGSATQDYDIVYEFIIPTDFASFSADALSIMVRSNDNAGNPLTVSMYDGSNVVDAGISGADIKPNASDTWQAKTDTPTGSYTAGDKCHVLVHMGNDEASNTVDISSLKLTYNTR